MAAKKAEKLIGEVNAISKNGDNPIDELMQLCIAPYNKKIPSDWTNEESVQAAEAIRGKAEELGATGWTSIRMAIHNLQKNNAGVAA
ncbi:hypothetical protein ACFLY0_01485 [Patescibacteria group bacterium]